MHRKFAQVRYVVAAIVLVHLGSCDPEAPMCQLDLPCRPHGEALCPVEVPCSVVPARPGFNLELVTGANLMGLVEEFGSVEVTMLLGGTAEVNGFGEDEEPGGGSPLPFADICRAGDALRFRSYEAEWVPFKTTPVVSTFTGFGLSGPEVAATAHDWQEPPFAELGVTAQIISTVHVRAEADYQCDDEFWIGSLVKASTIEDADGLECDPTQPPSSHTDFVAWGPWKEVTLQCEADSLLETQRVSLDDGDYRIVSPPEEE